MKKYLLSTLAVLVMGLSANAQTVISNDYRSTTTEKSVSNQAIQIDEKEYRYSGTDFSYVGVENAWGMKMNFIIRGFLAGYKFIFGKTNDYITTNDVWTIDLGYNYRHWLSKSFYIEGRAGLQYIHTNLEYETATRAGFYTKYSNMYQKKSSSSEKISEGNIGLFLAPRIGLALGESFAISAGYEWNFLEFNFDKAHTLDYFTVGISVLM